VAACQRLEPVYRREGARTAAGEAGYVCGGGDRTRRKGIRTPGGPDFIRRARLIAGDGCLDHTGRSAVEVGPVGCSPDTISVAMCVIIYALRAISAIITMALPA
jgi:hypothetical protein